MKDFAIFFTGMFLFLALPALMFYADSQQLAIGFQTRTRCVADMAMDRPEVPEDTVQKWCLAESVEARNAWRFWGPE